MGAIVTLLRSDYWMGDEAEIYDAQQQVHSLLSQLAYGECVSAAIGDVKQSVAFDDHNGWLKCDGRLLVAADYPLLASAMGAGGWEMDTTFNLPNFVGRVPVGAGTTAQGGATNRAQAVYFGANTHTLTAAQMPGHTHNQSVLSDNPAVTYGAAGGANKAAAAVNTTSTALLQTANAGGGQSHNILQPSLSINFFIYAGG